MPISATSCTNKAFVREAMELKMEKLVILKEGAIVDEIALEKLETSIGRDTANDICLQDPKVSRRHGLLIKVFNGYYFKDLGSTNGTILKRRRVKRHLMQYGDELGIGAFILRFVDDHTPVRDDEDDLDESAIDQTAHSDTPNASDPTAEESRQIKPKTAAIKFISGPDQGRFEYIERSLYTIGKPGGELAAIARRSQGFYLLHIGGDTHPRINNKEIDSIVGVKLNQGDLLQVGDTLAEITFD